MEKLVTKGKIAKLNSTFFKVCLHNCNSKCLEYENIHSLIKKIQKTNEFEISKNHDDFLNN